MISKHHLFLYIKHIKQKSLQKSGIKTIVILLRTSMDRFFKF